MKFAPLNSNFEARKQILSDVFQDCCKSSELKQERFRDLDIVQLEKAKDPSSDVRVLAHVETDEKGRRLHIFDKVVLKH